MKSMTGSFASSQSFLARVFMLMFIALGVSAFFAISFGNSPDLMATLMTKMPDKKISLTALGWVVMFAPLIFVMIMSFGYQSLSKPSLMLLFMLYAAINGISLSFIMLAYTTASLVGCFLSTAAMFGVMGAWGYITKKDLSSWGSILFTALIGIIISLFINMWLHSHMLDYIISIIGVVVFCALTAYDVQKLKSMAYNDKAAIMGALELYLDFLNLFLFLLRLFGSSKD
jgi:FtsH-binding integral membrane protein